VSLQFLAFDTSI